MDLKTLPALTVLSDNITIVEVDQVKVVRVIHEKATAGIALHGGHVVSFAPVGQEDLMWMSDSAIFDGKAALRGGIQFAGLGLAALLRLHMALLVTVSGHCYNIVKMNKAL